MECDTSMREIIEPASRRASVEINNPHPIVISAHSKRPIAPIERTGQVASTIAVI